jgi:hypothetical protein
MLKIVKSTAVKRNTYNNKSLSEKNMKYSKIRKVNRNLNKYFKKKRFGSTKKLGSKIKYYKRG